MEKQPGSALGVFDAGISLQQLVNNLLNESLSTAYHNKTRIVNEVTGDFVLGTNDENVVAVIKELLSVTIFNSSNGEIHVSAERYRDMVILLIEERNNNNGFALSFSIGSIEPEAAKIGGHIVIEGTRKKRTLITFSFPVQFAA
ncbi:MAG TPA: hypothetical protein PKI55_13735 [Chitinophagaceae bacterium]|nr:hypothetical protein [Chitinophagaceae bacterium]